MCPKCERCGYQTEPVFFEEEEFINGTYTGRLRNSVSHLICENCGKKICVDDSFMAQPWHY